MPELISIPDKTHRCGEVLSAYLESACIPKEEGVKVKCDCGKRMVLGYRFLTLVWLELSVS